ncbi:MAG: glycosyltransferase family 2 protein [Ignavibacteriae bacterium]|nr:glycosyltransferase family 2 protein [Ignavibacteriota bacterium]NOG97877.1 glycosyltransferase family 2 protein [Ignavibacteriota bacterium]
MQLYKSFTPVVSIILPTFNRAKLLSRAINSVTAQSFKNWELVIVDDGSDDSTFELVNIYIAEYQNIRYMKHSNRKLPLSLNTGITASAGKYIAFLDSDDEYDKNYLFERIEYLEKNSGIDLIYGGVRIIGDPFVPDKNDPTKRIHLSKCVIGGTFFGRREIFFELGGFNDLDYSEDSDFYERAKTKFVIKKIDFAKYIYHRDTEGSITNSI